MNDENQRYYLTYCKCDGMKTFKAFDINEGRAVGNLVYATMIKATDENKRKLQELADLNKGINLKVQLRQCGKKIVFETK
jgi:hypothetical protein